MAARLWQVLDYELSGAESKVTLPRESSILGVVAKGKADKPDKLAVRVLCHVGTKERPNATETRVFLVFATGAMMEPKLRYCGSAGDQHVFERGRPAGAS